MKRHATRTTGILLAVASLFFSEVLSAQPGQMMSDQAMQGMMQGQATNAPGSGYWGMGPMGGGMMGMGGHGSGTMMGPMGMMGMGMGMGMGMMGMGPMMMLDLSDDQQKKADAISDDLQKRHWDLMGKMRDEARKLRDLYRAEQRDARKIGAVYGKIFDYKRQMIETAIDAHNRQETLLTKEQKERLRQWRGRMSGY